MHALIIIAHRHPRSLTHALIAHIVESVVHAGYSAETADLASEGFEPRFNLASHVVHHDQASPPADVLAEQARIDRVDALVLVYPIYWWSTPTLPKGWIDRMFSNGWTLGYSIGGSLRKKLQRLRVVLIGVDGTDAGTFKQRGCTGAVRTQINHGIFNYCGARVIRSELLLEPESTDPTTHLEQARRVGAGLFVSARRPTPT